MSSFNQCILMGRLTRDPELRHTPSGKAVAGFRLAVDRNDGEKTSDFIDIVAWEKRAELAQKYLSKGRLALIIGRLQMRQYDAQDGTRRTVYEVVASDIRFLSDGNNGGKRDEGDGAPPAGGFAPFGSEFNPDDDVPF